MNRILNLEIASAVALTALVALSSCSAHETTPAVVAAEVTRQAQPVEPSCNLGARFDTDTMTTRARYDAPVSADYYLERYGEWVANEACTDSQVLAWQQLRRENGESDQICRVVYEYDSPMGTVYPIGCAVPVLVVPDAAR